MVAGGSQQETLDPDFMLLGTRQQGVPVILRELVPPEEPFQRVGSWEVTTALIPITALKTTEYTVNTNVSEFQSSIKKKTPISILNFDIHLSIKFQLSIE
ncbi:unnamed protein product [Schistosoma curassoni]|uniref:Uncharacterized protein n=1 Tax=Schistosoma curassoni TaxID=6186 RepID=A0A183K7T2_9TREM|nr:unnamed protein product [Schistosoma curassoni]